MKLGWFCGSDTSLGLRRSTSVPGPATDFLWDLNKPLRTSVTCLLKGDLCVTRINSLFFR